MTERDAILEGWRLWDDMDWVYTIDDRGRVLDVDYSPVRYGSVMASRCTFTMTTRQRGL
jgi:hypothetical protein